MKLHILLAAAALALVPFVNAAYTPEEVAAFRAAAPDVNWGQRAPHYQTDAADAMRDWFMDQGPAAWTGNNATTVFLADWAAYNIARSPQAAAETLLAIVDNVEDEARVARAAGHYIGAFATSEQTAEWVEDGTLTVNYYYQLPEDVRAAAFARHLGAGVYQRHYQTWYRGYLQTLSNEAAITSLGSELIGLTGVPQTDGRDVWRDELRAVLAVRREVAGS